MISPLLFASSAGGAAEAGSVRRSSLFITTARRLLWTVTRQKKRTIHRKFADAVAAVHAPFLREAVAEIGQVNCFIRCDLRGRDYFLDKNGCAEQSEGADDNAGPTDRESGRGLTTPEAALPACMQGKELTHV